MLKTRIAVMVSGGGTNLQALIEAQKSGLISHGEIVLTISNKEDAYALTRAKENGIKTLVMQDEYSLLTELKDEEIDMIVLAGFLKILSKDFIQGFGKPIINIHPSLIPSFCGKGCYGLHVHEKALEYGVKVTGATVHYVNEIPDGGTIIAQKAVNVLEDDTPEVLQQRVMKEAEWILLPEATEMICIEIMKGKE